MGEDSAAHSFARMRRRGIPVAECLRRIERMRSRGELPPLPQFELPELELSDNERTVLHDYLRNTLEHLAIGHPGRCTYSRLHCVSRTGLSENVVQSSIEALRIKGLMRRVGDTPSGFEQPAHIYEPSTDLLQRLQRALDESLGDRAGGPDGPTATTRNRPRDRHPEENDQGNTRSSSTKTDHEKDPEIRTRGSSHPKGKDLRPITSLSESVTRPVPHTCLICGADISHLRPQAKTCSGAHRKALSRRRESA